MEAELKVKNNIERVQKRDGRIVNFEQEKIANAIHKAVVAANQGWTEGALDSVKRVLTKTWIESPIHT